MRRTLTPDDVAAAVLGGAILGGGGGGLVEEGHILGRLATELGDPELWSIDELPEDAVVAVAALVGAPGAPDLRVAPAHYLRSLELLREALSSRHVHSTERSPAPPAAVTANENGAMATVNGWLQAAATGLPVLDAPCNGRAHPTGAMGALGQHANPAYVSVAAFAGGRAQSYLEGVVSGGLVQVATSVRAASVAAGGMVAVARNPVTVATLAAAGAAGAITQAIAVGRALLADGVAGVRRELGGDIAAEGRVDVVSIEQREGFDVGLVQVGDTVLTLVNEYMTAETSGQRRATFPDLIMTLDTKTERPIVSARLRPGDEVVVLTVPRDRLLLSSTMRMPELMEPIERLLDKEGLT